MIFLFSQVFSAIRLVFFLKSAGIRVKFPDGYNLTMVGVFFNMVIPGTIGGDVIKGFSLVKTEEEGKGRGAGIIIMDRFVGLLAVIFLAGISAVFLLQKQGAIYGNHRKELNILFTAIGLLVSLFLSLLLFSGNQSARNKLKKFFSVLFRQNIFYQMAAGMGNIGRDYGIIFIGFLISLLIQMSSLAGILVLTGLIPQHLPDAIILAAVSSIVLFCGIVPVTPGNLGWTEFVATFGWSAVGSGAGAAVFFYWRIVTILCSLPWGVLYICGKYRNIETFKNKI